MVSSLSPQANSPNTGLRTLAPALSTAFPKRAPTGSQAGGVRAEACVIEWSELLIGLAILFGTAMSIISAKRAIARVPKAAWVATDARETLVTLALLVFLIVGATLVVRFLLFELS